jgi:hypothetical protein
VSEQPRFTPIVEKPVRTVNAYRARAAKSRQDAKHDALKAHVEKMKEAQQ